MRRRHAVHLAREVVDLGAVIALPAQLHDVVRQGPRWVEVHDSVIGTRSWGKRGTQHAGDPGGRRPIIGGAMSGSAPVSAALGRTGRVPIPALDLAGGSPPPVINW